MDLIFANKSRTGFQYSFHVCRARNCVKTLKSHLVFLKLCHVANSSSISVSDTSLCKTGEYISFFLEFFFFFFHFHPII